MGYVEGLLGDNEKIVVKTRQHWIVLASSFLRNLVVALVVIILTAVLVFSPLGMIGLVALVLLLFPIVAFGRAYVDWYNEEYLVTNRRVIQAEGLVNKHVIDSSLEKVNDVVLTQSFFGRFLDYGDIEILTASEIGVNKLHKIARPVKFKIEMLNQKEALSVDDDHGPAHVRGHDDIPSMIAELDDLRKQGVLSETEFQQKKEQLLGKM
ncbi:MAG: PH domain-containing protein [Chloroflexi bacterium]|nr:PH domain-containing protein [Chloroflexota bacterium]